MKGLIITAVSFFVIQAGCAAKDKGLPLWEEQMKEVNRILAKYGYDVDSKASPTTRKVGTPFFNITFDGNPTEINVHTLRPNDIDLVGAMGDSLSAANGAGANIIPAIAFQYVGTCFSAGGDEQLETTLTLPNILKKFNDKIFGYGIGSDFGLIQTNHGFNVAVPGARARNMHGQAIELVQRLRLSEEVDWDEDWKLITLFIGGNDLCALGRDPVGASAETYVAEIKEALDYLHDTAKVPRMFINVIDILEIYLLPLVGFGAGSTRQCRVMQNSFCGYIIGADGLEREHIVEVNKQYQVQLQSLIDSGIYDTRDDFTVVIQPFLRDSVLPYTEDGRVDASYFAPDCFHFSDIGHAMAALNLWNNMMEPVGEKSTEWTLSNMKVPTNERKYIYTSKNNDVIRNDATDTQETRIDCPTALPDKHEWEIATVSVLAVLFLAESIGIVSLL